MGLNATKPVFRVSDSVRLPSLLSHRDKLEIQVFLVANLDMIHSKKKITRALISLRRCAGWSVPLLFANH